MKLACSSSAFDTQLHDGALTQIEWIEACARELRADGVVFDVRHFPRFDDDYLAQVKKMAADLGLTVAALQDDTFFAASDDAMQRSLEVALAIGAPLLTGTLEDETRASWSAQLDRLNSATRFAKQRNVTLAVRNAPGTFAASDHGLKRVSKEADSAWLRYALDVTRLDGASDATQLLPRTVLVRSAGEPPQTGATLLGNYCGFIVIDVDASEMNDAIRRWRTALFMS